MNFYIFYKYSYFFFSRCVYLKKNNNNTHVCVNNTLCVWHISWHTTCWCVTCGNLKLRTTASETRRWWWRSPLHHAYMYVGGICTYVLTVMEIAEILRELNCHSIYPPLFSHTSSRWEYYFFFDIGRLYFGY